MFPLAPLFALLCCFLLITPAHGAPARSVADQPAALAAADVDDPSSTDPAEAAPSEHGAASPAAGPATPPDAAETFPVALPEDAANVPPMIVIRGLAPVTIAATGLLDYLAPWLAKETGLTMDWTIAGDSQTLALARACGGDVLLANTSGAEASAAASLVRDGHAVERRHVMSDSYLVVGPPSDPAGIRGKNAVAALRTIADKGASFVSRGDASSLHRRELSLWRLAGRTVRDGRHGYGETGQGMNATLDAAAAAQAYTLTEKAAFAAWSAARAGNGSDPSEAAPLAILVPEEPVLTREWNLFTLNPALCPPVSPAVASSTETADALENLPVFTAGDGDRPATVTPLSHEPDGGRQTSAAIRAAGVKALTDWWASPSTQQRIAAYTDNGKAVFTPALPPDEAPFPQTPSGVLPPAEGNADPHPDSF